ncbi:unnamed protein product, partial [marine sediment metagenome]
EVIRNKMKTNINANKLRLLDGCVLGLRQLKGGK